MVPLIGNEEHIDGGKMINSILDIFEFEKAVECSGEAVDRCLDLGCETCKGNQE